MEGFEGLGGGEEGGNGLQRGADESNGVQNALEGGGFQGGENFLR